MTDPTVAHRDTEKSYWRYEQWLAAKKRERFRSSPERPWKITVSREGTRTIYVTAQSAIELC